MSSTLRELKDGLLRALVAMAYADGFFHPEEESLLDGFRKIFELTDADVAAIHRLVQQPDALDSLPRLVPDYDDRVHLLRLAFFMSIVDGRRSPEEKVLQEKLITLLRIRPEDVEGILTLSKKLDLLEERTRRYLEPT